MEPFVTQDLQRKLDLNEAARFFIGKKDVQDAMEKLLEVVKKHVDGQEAQHQKELKALADRADKVANVSARIFQESRSTSTASRSFEKEIDALKKEIANLVTAGPDGAKLKLVVDQQDLKLNKAISDLKNETSTKQDVRHVLKVVKDRLDFNDSTIGKLSSTLSMMAMRDKVETEFEFNEESNKLRVHLQQLEDSINQKLERLRKEPVPATFPVILDQKKGSEVFFLNEEPTRALGENKDVAFDLTSGYVYKKIDGNWQSQGQLTTGGSPAPTTGVEAPQIFHPSSGEVAGGTSTHTLPDGNDVFAVAVNGMILDASEWTQTATSLSITPALGYAATTDDITVHQNVAATEGVTETQMFNPSAGDVTGGSSAQTVATSQSVILVSIRGVVLKASEWVQVGTTLTVTPDLGFFDTSDTIQVHQNAAATGGLRAELLSNPNALDVTNGYRAVSLPDTNTVALVTHNGIVVDDAHWTRSGSTLTFTPEFGFSSTADTIQVYQNS